MNSEAPLACSLDAGEYKLRLSAIHDLGRPGLLSIEDRPDGARLSFRNSKELFERLTAIVLAESECCPFLSLEVDGTEDRLVLNVTAPPEALPIVRDLVGSFSKGQVLA